tara:strand:- start:5885 stop:6142 length:258 start_codon:yes stop_codon:yes gene_type:complete
MTRRDDKKTPAKTVEGAAPKRKRTNPFRYLAQVRQEGRKVTWTTRQETLVSTIMVLIMATLAAIFFFVVDLGISSSIDFILGLGS